MRWRLADRACRHPAVAPRGGRRAGAPPAAPDKRHDPFPITAADCPGSGPADLRAAGDRILSGQAASGPAVVPGAGHPGRFALDPRDSQGTASHPPLGGRNRRRLRAERDLRSENSCLATGGDADSVDRFRVYHLLLAPLEEVRQNPKFHPEGDALYHSLQVFELARAELPYDEEFQLAALLHDVGKAIEPRDPVAAGLAALSGHITERTAWLIEHQPHAAALRDGSLGARSRRRLEASESFDDLMLLYDCDRRGRASGVAVPELEEALDRVRELALLYGDEDA